MKLEKTEKEASVSEQKTIMNMIYVNPTVAIIQYRQSKDTNQKVDSGLKKKKNPTVWGVQGTYFKYKDSERLKVMGWTPPSGKMKYHLFFFFNFLFISTMKTHGNFV